MSGVEVCLLDFDDEGWVEDLVTELSVFVLGFCGGWKEYFREL